jgi:tetratricopeptide (TPR) repeat protein
LTPLDRVRERWESLLSARGVEELDTARDAFATLADEDSNDAQARYNLGLCFAWLGQNTEAIASFAQVVDLLAGVDPDLAERAWTLADVLRFGAGSEALTDDLSYTWAVDHLRDSILARWPNLVPRYLPELPPGEQAQLAGVRVFDWLDRPMPDAQLGPIRVTELPRTLASVIVSPNEVRLSTPDPTGLETLADVLLSPLARAWRAARKEARPLPLAMADAALGTARFPSGIGDEIKSDLARVLVEEYYEGRWLHLPRHALDGRSPLEAARAACAGDAVASVKLAAVVRFREQLGARASHAAIYQGYPFDRLRRRLGLVPDDGSSIAPEDPSCMSEPELDALEPAALDDERLADAFESAATLRDDPRIARFAAELVLRNRPALARLRASTVFGPLIRQALESEGPARAFEHLARALEISPSADRPTFVVWRAELQARTGDPKAALESYRSLLKEPDVAAAVALGGARTLIANGYSEHARPLIREARRRERVKRLPYHR